RHGRAPPSPADLGCGAFAGRPGVRSIGRLPEVRYWLETLGCPKNQVDSDKLVGTLEADGYEPAPVPEEADLVVVNTCAFIEAARQESLEAVLELSEARRRGARLVVTGCMAERYGPELSAALPEVDLVAGFGVPVQLIVKGKDKAAMAVPSFDLLNLPRPPAKAPWAYVKVAEGCDRRCGFCAIPSFRGRQRSRRPDDVLAEVGSLGVEEVVLVAQDLASYGRDLGLRRAIVPLVRAVAASVARVRLLYLYPSELTDGLIDVMGETGCPYFDLSLQHVARPLLRRMRRWGDGDRFLARIEQVRERYPDAALRSSFIVGYPGETEEDHDRLLAFLEAAELDWAGFFSFSPEEGTHAAGLTDRVPPTLVSERLAECGEIQDAITARRRRELVGRRVTVLVDEPGVARGHREAPEIDGVVRVPELLAPGSWADVVVSAAVGPDLEAAPVPGGAS
ncbi:MAG: 30S ribosomal protein S12 methylthiotransferase RimO, partial [Acidimicrobiales bacterium]